MFSFLALPSTRMEAKLARSWHPPHTLSDITDQTPCLLLSVVRALSQLGHNLLGRCWIALRLKVMYNSYV